MNINRYIFNNIEYKSMKYDNNRNNYYIFVSDPTLKENYSLYYGCH